MQDYLVKHTKNGIVDISGIIDEDYFKAVRILFREGLYVSCSKLLMSCIDTLSFVEFGDVTKNFSMWLDEFVDLEKLNISSEELLEFRHSLLHMTNLASRKVIRGDVSSISPYVGVDFEFPPIKAGQPRPFNLHKLIHVVAAGIVKWGESYNLDRDKFTKFIERYDTIISDGRPAYIQVNSEKT